MAQLNNTRIDGSLIVNDGGEDVDILETINGIKDNINTINSIISVLSNLTDGQLILPSGLKIFWGIGTTSSSKDPANVYSFKIVFPQSFQSTTSYTFIATDYMIGSNNSNLFPTVFSYYGRGKDNIWVGSKYYSKQKFNWIAIGV